MSKPKVKIVIGANYGDEGKGLATDYFTQKAKGPVLNVLYNGGPQRGHTVEHKNGLRHIFHHFGSGFFSGASTYFDENFLVDPIKFNIEHCELLDQARYFTDMTEEEAIKKSICFCHPNCRVITPWDAMANQILAKHKEKHNTCGCGIWTTIERYNGHIDTIPNSMHSLYFRDLIKLDDMGIQVELMNLSLNWFYWLAKQITGKNYYELSLEDRENKSFLGDYAGIFLNPSLRDHFIYDLRQMQKRTIIANLDEVTPKFETIIFEGGQGLAIGMQNTLKCNTSTPSFTGSALPIMTLIDEYGNRLTENIEICYVTRTYLTRHGDGYLPNACSREGLGINYQDLTNQSNQFQGKLRYAPLIWKELYMRISQDLNQLAIKQHFPDTERTIMVTHVSDDGQLDPKEIVKFDDCYVSKSPYSEEVEVWHSYEEKSGQLT